jgi:hypothetical protein
MRMLRRKIVGIRPVITCGPRQAKLECGHLITIRGRRVPGDASCVECTELALELFEKSRSRYVGENVSAAEDT